MPTSEPWTTLGPRRYRSWLLGEILLVCLLASGTALFAASDSLKSAYELHDARLAFDTAVAVVATFVCVLTSVRFLVEGRTLDLLLAAGFLEHRARNGRVRPRTRPRRRLARARRGVAAAWARASSEPASSRSRRTRTGGWRRAVARSSRSESASSCCSCRGSGCDERPGAAMSREPASSSRARTCVSPRRCSRSCGWSLSSASRSAIAATDATSTAGCASPRRSPSSPICTSCSRRSSRATSCCRATSSASSPTASCSSASGGRSARPSSAARSRTSARAWRATSTTGSRSTSSRSRRR